MRPSPVLALLLVATVAAAAAADEPAVDADAPSLRVVVLLNGAPALSPQVKVGEPFHIVVSAKPGPDMVVTLPASFDTGKFEVIDRREVMPAAGSPERSFDLTVVAWEPGKQTFPPIPVSYVAKGLGELKKIETAGLDVEVLAVLGDEQSELRPISPPVSVYERDWTLVVMAGAATGALLLGTGVWLWVRAARRRRRAAAAAAPVVDLRPPHEIALEKLRALRPVLDAVDRRPFYFAVTEVLREYLGRRFGFGALDMTSREVVEALTASPDVAAPLRDQVERWLGACDLVKFARLPASRDQASHTLDAALTLVEESRPPPPAGEGARA